MADYFVNPSWSKVYVKGSSAYKADPGDAVEYTRYSTLQAAVNAAASDASTTNTIYLFSTSSSPISLVPTNSDQAKARGTYNPSSSTETYSYTASTEGADRLNLVVRAHRFERPAGAGTTRDVLISGDITMDFRVFDSIKLGTGIYNAATEHASFSVENGAVFMLRKISPFSTSWALLTNIDQFTVTGATVCCVGSYFNNEGDNSNPPKTNGICTVEENSLFLASKIRNGRDGDDFRVSGSTLSVGIFVNDQTGTSLTVSNSSTVYAGVLQNNSDKNNTSISVTSSTVYAGKVDTQRDTASITVTDHSAFSVAGETNYAMLNLTVASGTEARDVTATVAEVGGAAVGTYTLAVAAGQTAISLVSADFVKGKHYEVTYTDTASSPAQDDLTAVDGSGGSVLDLAGFSAGAARTITVYVQKYPTTTTPVNEYRIALGANQTTARLYSADFDVTGGTYCVWTNEDPDDRVMYFSRVIGDGSVTNKGSITVTDHSTFSAESLNNNAATAYLKVDDSTVSISGTLTNSGKKTNDKPNQGILVEDSTFEVGTWDNTVFAGSAVANNSGTITVTTTGGEGTTASTFRAGNVTNTGTITVDAGSKFYADSFTNASGTFSFVSADSADPASGYNVSMSGSFNNAGGTITIDIAGLSADTYDSMIYQLGRIKAADFTVDQANTGTISLVCSDPELGYDVSALQTSFDADGHILIGRKTSTFFVNRLWHDQASTSPKSAKYKGVTPTLTYGVNAFGNVQEAIDHALPGDTIVFLHTTGDDDFKFYLDNGGRTVIDKELTFSANESYSNAVKFGSIKITSGVETTFQTGTFSMGDILRLENDATLDIVESAKFNADLVESNGTIIVGTSSRLVADAIEGGTISIRTGFYTPATNNKKWIIRPIEATIGDTVTMQFLSPWRSVYGDGTSNPKKDIITYEGIEKAVAVYTVTNGEKINKVVAGGVTYFYTGDTVPAWVAGLTDPVTSTWCATTENNGLFLVDEGFDLTETEPGSKVVTTNAIYVDNDWTGDTTTFTVHSNNLTEYGSETVTLANAVFGVLDDTAITTQYPAGKVTDPTANVFNNFIDAFNAAILNTHGIGQEDQGMVIRVKAGDYTNVYSGTICTKPDEKIPRDILVEPDKYWDSANQEWVYDEVNITFGIGSNFTKNSTSGNDYYNDFNPGTSYADLITFAHLKSLTIGDWEFSSKGSETSVVSFIDIDNLTVTNRLKPMGGATTRIINCKNVVSDHHFSVTGGTLIIDGSTVTLVGKNTYGALSTKNNSYGNGTVIIRNSVLNLVGSSQDNIVVNLKEDAEFTISGMSTVSGVFTNLNDGAAGSDTCIIFSNAILDYHTVITSGQENGLESGAALKFNGYNTLDGTSISQIGDKDMTVEAGATLNMTGGANISVGGDVLISNAGIISLDDSTITAGDFDNTGNMVLKNGAEITLDDGSGTFTNNGTLRVDLKGDGTLGINGNIVNNRDLVIDVSNTDLPGGQLEIPLSALTNYGIITVIGHGEKIVDAGTGAVSIRLEEPQTETLYVNRKWDGAEYVDGKNVGSYTYFGFNAYRDNSGTGSLKFSGDTDKLIYYGGNIDDTNATTHAGTVYQALDLSGLIQTITFEGNVYTRYSTDDRKDGGAPHYAWKYVIDETHDDVIYTAEINPETDADVYRDTHFDNPVGQLSDPVPFAFDQNSPLVITTVERTKTAADDFTDSGAITAVSSGSITVGETVYQRSASGDQRIRRENFYAWKSEAGDVVYTMNTLTPTTATHYYIDNEIDRDLVTMKPLTISGSQAVMLAGAEMALENDGTTTDSVVNSGTLTVTNGQSAKLTLDVVSDLEDRDIVVAVASNADMSRDVEYYSVHVPAGATTVDVESKRFTAGTEYYVAVTDHSKESAGNTGLTVSTLGDAISKMIVQTSTDANARFIFDNVSVTDGHATVNPVFQNSDLASLVNLEYLHLDEELETLDLTAGKIITDGKFYLQLTVNSGHLNAARNVVVEVQNSTGRYEYTFKLAAGDYSNNTFTAETPACFNDQDDYYVEIEQQAILKESVPSEISESVINAQDITNSGTLNVVTSVGGGHSGGKLVFNCGTHEHDWEYKVVINDGTISATYDAFSAANTDTATITSPDFNVGASYNITSVDGKSYTGGPVVAQTLSTLTATGTVANTGTVNVTNADFTAHEVSTSGHPFNVSGYSKLTIGTLSGTINLLDGATLADSGITGGGIAATGAVTVKDSSLSSNTISVSTGSLVFTGTNTLKTINLSASGQAVTNSGTLNIDAGESTLTIGTLSGTIDLLDGAVIKNSTITSGTGTLNIASGNNVTFSGANTMSSTAIDNDGAIVIASGSSLEAGAIDNDGEITVSGTLTSGAIANADGEITVDGTLNAASITDGEVSVSNKLDVTNSISNVALTVTAAGATSSADVAVKATGGISNSSVTLTVDPATLTGADSYQYVAADLDNVTFTVNGESVTELQEIGDTGYLFTTQGNTGVWLVKAQSLATLYVNSTYTGDSGTLTTDGNDYLIGWNAFQDNSTLAFAVSAENPTVIDYAASATPYSALDLGSATNAPSSLTITTSGSSAATMGPLTVGNGSTVDQTVTFSGANMTLTDAGTAPDITASLTVSEDSTVNVGGASASTVTAGTVDNDGMIEIASGSSLEAGAIDNDGEITVSGTLTSGEITNTNGTIRVDATSRVTATSVSGGVIDIISTDLGTTLTANFYILVKGTLTNNPTMIVDGDSVHPVSDKDAVGSTDYLVRTLGNTGVFLTRSDVSELFVNNSYTGGLGDETEDHLHLIGYDAFTDNPLTTDDTSLSFDCVPSSGVTLNYAATGTAYSALDLGSEASGLTGLTITTSGSSAATMGPLTVGKGSTVDQTVTFSGANMTLTDAGTAPDITASLTVSEDSTVNVGGASASTVTAGTVDNDGTINVLEGSSLGADDVTNTGEISVDGTMTATGTINNNATSASITVNGTLNAVAINNSATAEGSGITVNGALSATGDIDNDGNITINGTGTLSATGAIDNDGGTITINNIGDTPAITASSIDNGSGTIMITATGFSGGTQKVIDVDSKSTLNVADIAFDAAETGGRLAQGADGDIYITNQDQTTLYVNSSYTGPITSDGHIYGYNGFSSLSQITYHGTSVGQTAQYPETTTIEFTAASNTYEYGSYLLYYTNNDVTLKGTEANSSVRVNSGRMYLMTAVPGAPGDYATNVSTTTAKTFTIDNGLSLTVSSMLKVGDVVDSGESRTGGVANLVVKNGSVNNYVTVTPYSSVTVLKDGALTYETPSPTLTNCSYIRPHGVLTVHGTAANVTDAASTTTVSATSSSAVQYQMDRTAFADGGTLNIYSAHAKMNHIRLYDVSDRTIPATGAVVNFDHAYVENYGGVIGNFFEWDTTTVAEPITVNVTASTWKLGDLALNPNTHGTVNVNNSTVSTASVTNGGTFNVSGESTLTIGTLDGTITLLNGTVTDSTISAVDTTNGGTLNVASAKNVTFSGTNAFAAAIDNDGAITVNGTLTAGDVTNNGGHTITIDASTFEAGSVTNNGTLSVTNSSVFNADSVTNDGGHTITIDASTFEAGSVTNNGTLSVTNSSVFNADSVTNESTRSIVIDASTFEADSVTNNGTLSVRNSSTFQAGTVTNEVLHSIVIDASTFEADSVTNKGTLSVTNSSEFNADSVTNEAFRSIVIDASTFNADSVLNNGTFNVSGESTLTIGTLSGNAIQLLDGAVIKNSTITSGTGTLHVGTHLEGEPGSETPVRNNVTFSGTNAFAAAIDNDGSITVVGTLTAGAIDNDDTIRMDVFSRIVAASIDNTGADSTSTADDGAFVVDLTGYDPTNKTTGGMKNIVHLATDDEGILNDYTSFVRKDGMGDDVPVTSENYFLYYDRENCNYWLTDEDQSTVYVNSKDWANNDSDFGKYNGNVELSPSSTVHAYAGYNGFQNVSNATATAAAASNRKIVVLDGEFTSSNAPTFNGVDTTIKGGLFSTSICGGTFFQSSSAKSGSSTVESETPVSGNITLNVENGTFTKIFFAGDRVNVQGAVTRTGGITTTISGGEFQTAVAGALAYTYGGAGNTDGITLIGDVNLTIKGGTFTGIAGQGKNKDWIYGGCLSTTKALAAQTTIQGNVTVTLDASDRNVTIGNLVAGSYGEGVITGNTRLVLTGIKDSEDPRESLTITATGEIWGGCSADKYAVSYITTVDGNRTLSFTGFQGELKCDKIRAFNYAEFVKDDDGNATTATLNNNSGSGLDMGYVENWTFENGCSLTGNFKNDFADDKLNLMGVISGETVDWTILTNTNEAGFSNFNGMEVYLNGSSSSKGVIADNALAWSDSGINYTLALDGGVLSLKGVAAATIA